MGNSPECLANINIKTDKGIYEQGEELKGTINIYPKQNSSLYKFNSKLTLAKYNSY